MVRLKVLAVLVAVISLPLNVIWPNVATAAAIPQIVSLGELREGVAVPGRIDIDAQGDLYVVEIGAGQILKFDSAGTLKNTFPAVSISGSALAVNPDGTYIYAAEKTGRIAVLDAQTGEQLNYLGDLTTTGDIAVDPQGNIYVVDTANINIVKYSPAGVLLTTISGAGNGAGLFRRISELAINASSGEIYVAGEYLAEGGIVGTAGSSTVQVFSLDGVFQGKIEDTGGFIALCKGIAFGPDGLEFYLDRLKGNIRVRDRATGYLSTLSIKGAGAGLMQVPVDLVYDATSQRILVAADTAKIEIFGVNGGVTPAANQAPSLPELISPIAGGNAASLTPQLRFRNAVDANNDSVTYDVELNGELLADNAQNGATESYVTTVILAENSQYSWRVLARDEHGAESGWTAEHSFFVNAVNEAPTAPILAATDAKLNGGALLTWSEATDPDPNDTLLYRVELAEDITFSEVTLSADLVTTAIQLSTFADYADLQDGVPYVWRVSAVDKAGLATRSEIGSFVYDTAMLTVSANMPDAQVSLGGNAAYAGKSVGVAPVQFRDLPAGAYTVVVERAGCEQFIAQVEISGAANADVAAVLKLAIAPELRRDEDLRVGKSKLRVGLNAAPFVVDFNNDGLIDLLVGDESGMLTLFVASTRGGGSRVWYEEGEQLKVAPISGAVPFVVDWNNDNRKDLLVGGVDGRVFLFLQETASSDLSPVFSAGTPLKIDALDDLNVESPSAPAVADIDGDGDKDLVVGTASGKLLSFLNVGTDAVPLLAAATQIGSFSGPVAPLFIDWDADGQRDLLISNAGGLNLLVKNENGMFTVAQTLLSDHSAFVDENIKYFVADLDSAQGKDVLAGFSDGKVTCFESVGRDYLPSVTRALLDKLAQVQTLAGDAVSLDTVAAAIEGADYSAAGRLAKRLFMRLPASSELETASAELLLLLGQ